MAVGVATFAVLALLPSFLAVSWIRSMTLGLVYSIVFLSLVVLTGYSGQISLGQTAFMGLAAFTTGHLVVDAGLSPWLALVLGSLAAVPAGVVVGLIAVRLHGLFLGLMTLAVAFMAQELFFGKPIVSGVEGLDVPRPALVDGPRSFYLLTLAVLAGFALLAVSLRTGRTGRVLGSIRDSETATRALGVNVVKYKTIIFGLSAFMAAVGGTLLAMTKENANRLDFIPFLSLIYLTLTVIGGLFHVGGAIVSGILFGVYPKLFGNVEFMLDIQLILFGLGASFALAEEPEGMFGQLRRAGHAILGLFRRRAPAVAAARDAP
jgi:branched-chain amino acid transport system permease protein